MIEAEQQRQTARLNPPLPKWVFLQLLESCNLRCKMCYQWGDDGPYKEKKILRQLDIEAVKNIIKTCAPSRPYYELYGGEPLMYPHIDEVLKSISEAGSKVQIPTNGTLVEKHAELLIRYAPDIVWISLDGPPDINDRQRGKGVFQKAMRGIDKLYELRAKAGSSYPRIGINSVITPANHRDLEYFFFEALDISKLDCISLELQTYLTEDNHRQFERVLRHEFGIGAAPLSKGFVGSVDQFKDMDAELLVRQVQTIKAYGKSHGIYVNTFPQEMTTDNVNKYFSANWFEMSKVKRRCPFPWISTEINAGGDVTTCHAFYDLTLGNIYEEGLEAIWNGEKYAKYRQYLRKQLLPICQACGLFYNEKPGGRSAGAPAPRETAEAETGAAETETMRAAAAEAGAALAGDVKSEAAGTSAAMAEATLGTTGAEAPGAAGTAERGKAAIAANEGGTAPAGRGARAAAEAEERGPAGCGE